MPAIAILPLPAVRESDLNAAIATVNGRASTDVFNFAASFTLTTTLTPLVMVAGETLTIAGGGFAIDGGASQGGLFVYSGTVTIKNLTLANMGAQGSGSGGGGAGLGGGLFVGSFGDVTLSGVSFTNDAANGGASQGQAGAGGSRRWNGASP